MNVSAFNHPLPCFFLEGYKNRTRRLRWPVLVPFGALVARRCLARAMRSFPQYWVLVTATYFGTLFAVGVAYPLSTGETVLRTAFDAVTKPS